jgi:Ni,Fe-hydrogenase I cytochrome b subunit
MAIRAVSTAGRNPMRSKKTVSEAKPESPTNKNPIPWRKVIYYVIMGIFLVILGFLLFATLAS